ncbi:hypothetical protein PHAVU_001G100000 [Phaseolus vulgaris]|uniref:Uncharacterized protein n=1 Tax=Phaseolus vulgaris TaxID=3885 RepID=V7CWR4_PHAVU|nr:hypothetical protein PHAVU_001G100000g [Phaseolus vulgaris]ESW33803.1 hypothetical protein PHAVU_001G100000g [Phaseolus vulgaris]
MTQDTFLPPALEPIATSSSRLSRHPYSFTTSSSSSQQEIPICLPMAQTEAGSAKSTFARIWELHRLISTSETETEGIPVLKSSEGLAEATLELNRAERLG